MKARLRLWNGTIGMRWIAVVMALDALGALGALGAAGCGDNEDRPAPDGVEVRIVAGPGGVTGDATPTWAFTTRGAPAVVECALDGGAAVPCRDSFTPAAALADGEHSFAVRAADAAGHEGADGRTVRVDTGAPRIALQAPQIPPRTSDRRPAVAFTVDDASEVAVSCRLDAGPEVRCDAGFAAPADLAEGPHAVRVTATDAAGNASSVDIEFDVDVTPPDVAITGGPVNQTSDDTPSFEFTTSPDTTRARCEMDTGEVIDPCTTGVTFAAIAAGPHTFTVTAFDDAVPANAASATASFALVLGQCGDGVKNGSELCDGADVGAVTCESLGHAPGALACNATCDGFDAGGCDGGFVAAGAGFSGRPCFDGVKFGQPGLLSPHLVACSEDSGAFMAALGGPVSWAPINGATAGSTITNLHGRAILPQPDGPATVYLSDGSTAQSAFRSNNVMLAPSPAWVPVTFADAGAPIEVFAAAPGTSTNNVVGGWDAVRGAVVLHGNFAATAAVSAVGPPGSVTGTVCSIAKGATNDLYVAVWGKTPAGDPATGGGIYLTCDQVGTAGGTYLERDTGIDPEDRPLVWSITVDPSSVASTARTCGTATFTGFATTYYAALRGGGQVYKTADGGETWARSNAGLPAGAEVYKIAIDCFSTAQVAPPASRCADHALLYAATSAGLYRSTDAGAHWALAGFEGKVVRGVALEPEHAVDAPPQVFTGVDDAVGIYQRR